MSRFKVGDKVKVIADLGDGFEGVRIGDEGIVLQIHEGFQYPIELDIADKYGYGFKEEELELIDETIKLYTDEYLLVRALQYIGMSKSDLIAIIECE